MIASMAKVVSKLVVGVRGHWARWLTSVAAWATVATVVIVALTTWRILGSPVDSTSDLVAQGQLLVAAVGLIATVALVATTVYYAWQTKKMVDEAKAARDDEREHHRRAIATDRVRELEGSVAALRGASLDVVTAGSMLHNLRVHHRLWRVRSAEPLMQAMASASKATDLLRYQSPGPLADAAGALHDELLRYMQACMSGLHAARLQALAEEIGRHKSELDAALSSRIDDYRIDT